MVNEHIESGVPAKQNFEGSSPEIIKLRQKTHKTLLKVKDDYERRHSFNTAVAAIMELTNFVPKEYLSNKASLTERSAADEAIKNILIMISPIAPHVSQELWSMLDNEDMIINVNWPNVNEKLLIENLVELVIQVNGKLRGKIEIETDLANEEVEVLALKNENVHKHIEGKKIKKFIYIPNKLINIVV